MEIDLLYWLLKGFHHTISNVTLVCHRFALAPSQKSFELPPYHTTYNWWALSSHHIILLLTDEQSRPNILETIPRPAHLSVAVKWFPVCPSSSLAFVRNCLGFVSSLPRIQIHILNHFAIVVRPIMNTVFSQLKFPDRSISNKNLWITAHLFDSMTVGQTETPFHHPRPSFSELRYLSHQGWCLHVSWYWTCSVLCNLVHEPTSRPFDNRENSTVFCSVHSLGSIPFVFRSSDSWRKRELTAEERVLMERTL